MATSTLKAMENIGSALGGPATFLSTDRPLSTDIIRALANNVHHGYDQSTQFRVNWTAAGATPSRIELSPAVADTYELLQSFGPFPWAIRHDGEYMRPVYRLGGSVDNASYTATFKLCFMQDVSPRDHNLAVDDVELSTTSTSDVFLTPTNNYFAPSTTDDPPLQALKDYDTLVEPSGDSTRSRIYQMRLDVWIKATNVAATVRLYSLHMREYIGT